MRLKFENSSASLWVELFEGKEKIHELETKSQLMAGLQRHLRKTPEVVERLDLSQRNVDDIWHGRISQFEAENLEHIMKKITGG